LADHATPLVFVLKLPIHQTDPSDPAGLMPYDISCIVLRFDPNINVSTGFIIASERGDVGRLLEDFRSDFGACHHPLSMLVKFGQTQTDALVRRIDQLYRGLSESEGQRTSLPDIALLDISTRLAFSEKNRTCCVSLLTFLHQQIQWLRDNSAGKVDPTLMDNLENRLEILSSSVDQLPSYDSLKSLIQSRQDQVCPFGPEPVIPSEA
jgi:hypothetical protein